MRPRGLYTDIVITMSGNRSVASVKRVSVYLPPSVDIDGQHEKGLRYPLCSDSYISASDQFGESPRLGTQLNCSR